MTTQELLDYIKQQLQLGKSQDQIKQALIAGGWKAEDVDHGFASIASGVPAPVNSELPKAKAIYTEAWAIYTNRFKTLIAISAIPVVAYFLLALVIGFYVAATLLHPSDTTRTIIYILLGILFLVVVLAIIYMGIWATVAQLYAIKDQAEGIGWKEAFKRAKPKLLVFFTTSLLVGLAVLGGTILLIIPGIIFGLWFSQASYIVVEEGLSNTAALSRSKYYVKGRIGQTFGKLFYIGIITFGLYIGVIIVISILTAVSRGAYFSWLTNVFSFVWTPMVTVYAYQLYKHLKATRA